MVRSMGTNIKLLIETVQKQDIKVTGKARLSDIKVKPKTGKVEVQSGTVNLDIKETAAGSQRRAHRQWRAGQGAMAARPQRTRGQ